MNAEAEKLVEQCMDAFLYDNGLGGAGPHAGDAIVGLVWATIEDIVEEGELTEVAAIVEEASSRAEVEIEDILDEEREYQEWLAEEEEEEDDDDEEVCNA